MKLGFNSFDTAFFTLFAKNDRKTKMKSKKENIKYSVCMIKPLDIVFIFSNHFANEHLSYMDKIKNSLFLKFFIKFKKKLIIFHDGKKLQLQKWSLDNTWKKKLPSCVIS